MFMEQSDNEHYVERSNKVAEFRQRTANVAKHLGIWYVDYTLVPRSFDCAQDDIIGVILH